MTLLAAQPSPPTPAEPPPTAEEKAAAEAARIQRLFGQREAEAKAKAHAKVKANPRAAGEKGYEHHIGKIKAWKNGKLGNAPTPDEKAAKEAARVKLVFETREAEARNKANMKADAGARVAAAATAGGLDTRNMKPVPGSKDHIRESREVEAKVRARAQADAKMEL